MKDKRSNRYKTAAWILLIAGIVSFSVINIFSLFFHYSNRIHNEILNRNMEQISLLSDYIVKIIRSEMRHCTEILNIGEENFSVPEKMTSAEIVKQLQEIRSRAGFAQIGIMDQEGNTIDDTGNRWQIDDSELLAAMEKGRAIFSVFSPSLSCFFNLSETFFPSSHILLLFLSGRSASFPFFPFFFFRKIYSKNGPHPTHHTTSDREPFLFTIFLFYPP